MPVTSIRAYRRPRTVQFVDQQHAPPAPRRRRHAIANPRRFAPLAATALRRAGRRSRRSAPATCPPSAARSTAFAAGLGARRPRARCTPCCRDAARRRTTLRAAAAHLQAGGRDAHARAGPAPGRSTTTTTVADRRSRPASSARCRARSSLPTGERKDADPGIDWRAELVYPGLRRGEKLRRETTLPAARDDPGPRRHPDRQGPGPRCPTSDRSPPRSPGTIGPAPPERAARARGPRRPAGAAVGLTGLEREFDERLTGTPGGIAVRRRPRARQHASPSRGRSVRTTIDPKIQRAAVEALAGRYGGIAVVRPSNGEVLALAGIAQSAPQPPGSTFKIVTLAGVLENKVAKRTRPSRSRPRRRSRASRSRTPTASPAAARCAISFAHSCNSRLRPAGRQARRRASSSRPPSSSASTRTRPLAGAARSTIPAAAEIGDDLAVGSSAIGQGKVLATPLQMALVARDDRRRRHAPARRRCSRAPTRSASRATPTSVARTIKSYMRTVVTDGTGGAAALPGVKVAGKTGTAELRTTVKEEPPPEVTDPDAAAAGGRHDRHRRLVRRVRAATASRRSPSRCCSSARARAATPPRPRPASRSLQSRASARGRGRSRPSRSPPPARSRASSGRFCSESVLSRKRISEPWIGPLAAAESGVGSTCVVAAAGSGRRRTRSCRVQRDRPELVLLGVHDRELVGRRQRLVRVVLDPHPDAEPDLVAGQLRGRCPRAGPSGTRGPRRRPGSGSATAGPGRRGCRRRRRCPRSRPRGCSRSCRRSRRRRGERGRAGRDSRSIGGGGYSPPTVARGPRSMLLLEDRLHAAAAPCPGRASSSRGGAVTASMNLSVGSAGSDSVVTSTRSPLPGRRQRPRRPRLVAVELPAAAGGDDPVRRARPR